MPYKSQVSLVQCVPALFLAAVAMLAGCVQAKSVHGLGEQCPASIDRNSLYPETDVLALHPMLSAPFQDGSVPAQGPCPGTVTSGDPLNVRSTCPFEYVTDYDQDRIPATLLEARCLCDGCLDPYTGRQSADLACLPITYAVKVLRKNSATPSTGYDMYTLATQNVAVGCACSRVV